MPGRYIPAGRITNARTMEVLRDMGQDLARELATPQGLNAP